MIKLLDFLIRLIATLVLALTSLPLLIASLLLWDYKFIELLDTMGEYLWENKKKEEK